MDEGQAKEWMKAALVRAEKALQRSEVPVGCLFIYNQNVIAIGSNEVNETKNATRHAEMTCIDTVLAWCTKEEKKYEDVFAEVSFCCL